MHLKQPKSPQCRTNSKRRHSRQLRIDTLRRLLQPNIDSHRHVVMQTHQRIAELQVIPTGFGVTTTALGHIKLVQVGRYLWPRFVREEPDLNFGVTLRRWNRHELPSGKELLDQLG